jgi:hypothetical protein
MVAPEERETSIGQHPEEFETESARIFRFALVFFDMAHSGTRRHRDREPGHRGFEDLDIRTTDRVFKITEAERQQVAHCLRYIDEARRALERQQNRDNREIIRELRASADRIYDVMNGLDETDG